ncbi:hypothetical protein [uncultured Photobacterium sp.]|uniref:hypothetical protein n=1 Tax=uncultured Photobacterium sp. TaxID=173973 RepID=UPI002638265E|nr:hypothetical protein [uncultured Photobacterium sp.]
MMEMTNLIRLPDHDAGAMIVRVENSNIDSQRKDETKFFRREPVVIENLENGRWVVRYVMGNPGTVKGLQRHTLALDYDAIDGLFAKYGEGRFVVRRANMVEIGRWLWFESELNNKLAFRLATIGGVLGVIGFIISIVTLF